MYKCCHNLAPTFLLLYLHGEASGYTLCHSLQTVCWRDKTFSAAALMHITFHASFFNAETGPVKITIQKQIQRQSRDLFTTQVNIFEERYSWCCVPHLQTSRKWQRLLVGWWVICEWGDGDLERWSRWLNGARFSQKVELSVHSHKSGAFYESNNRFMDLNRPRELRW